MELYMRSHNIYWAPELTPEEKLQLRDLEMQLSLECLYVYRRQARLTLTQNLIPNCDV
jgi:hypothetical protein